MIEFVMTWWYPLGMPLGFVLGALLSHDARDEVERGVNVVLAMIFWPLLFGLGLVAIVGTVIVGGLGALAKEIVG